MNTNPHAEIPSDPVSSLDNLNEIVYVDMDGVITDWDHAVLQLSPDLRREYEGRLEDIPGFFSNMRPMPGAIAGFLELQTKYDVHILSTPPWENDSGWSDKPAWVKRYLGKAAEKRLTLTHHKNLSLGSYLIDDRRVHGVEHFIGEHIHFGSEEFPTWAEVLDYLMRGRRKHKPSWDSHAY
jgi:5'-nucleotidase